MFESFEQAQAYVAEQGIRMVDLKFCDLWGRWHHLTIPAGQFVPALMTQSIGFDGSAARPRLSPVGVHLSGHIGTAALLHTRHWPPGVFSMPLSSGKTRLAVAITTSPVLPRVPMPYARQLGCYSVFRRTRSMPICPAPIAACTKCPTA